MKLQTLKYKCENCKFEFRAPQILSGSYAEFLLRSSSTECIRYLDAMEDKTYDEVDTIIKSNPRLKGKSANALADILRKSYGAIACDLDDRGNIFQIGALPACPSCGSQSMEYWEAIEPPEFLFMDVPHITHSNWHALTQDEKTRKADQALSSMGY